jgi:Kringle domain
VPACPDTGFMHRRQCGTMEVGQSDYRGDVKVSETGAECLYWIGEEATAERYTPWDRPWEGLAENFCRNPAQNSRRHNEVGLIRSHAWCLVGGKSDSGFPLWEYCDIEACQDCGSEGLSSSDYTGTQSQTRSGKECLPWEGLEDLLVQENSTVFRNVTMLGETVLYRHGIQEAYHLEANFCRNPLPNQREKTFCYVDSTPMMGAKSNITWEYCDVPACPRSEFVTRTTCGSQSLSI